MLIPKSHRPWNHSSIMNLDLLKNHIRRKFSAMKRTRRPFLIRVNLTYWINYTRMKARLISIMIIAAIRLYVHMLHAVLLIICTITLGRVRVIRGQRTMGIIADIIAPSLYKRSRNREKINNKNNSKVSWSWGVGKNRLPIIIGDWLGENHLISIIFHPLILMGRNI